MVSFILAFWVNIPLFLFEDSLIHYEILKINFTSTLKKTGNMLAEETDGY